MPFNINFEESGNYEIVETGISDFDKLCGGGILRGSVVTLSGFPGNGKSTFGMQFLLEGANKYDENGVYILFEDNVDSALLQFAHFDWNLNELIESQKISILDYPISEIDQILSPQGVVKDFIDKMNAKRIVIDSIFPIGLYYQENRRDNALISFINMVKGWNRTVMITAFEDVNVKYPQTTFGIERFTDGWIRLNDIHIQDERKRTLEIMKMRGMKHSLTVHNFNITNKGIKIYNEEYNKNAKIKKKPNSKNTKIVRKRKSKN